MHVFVVYIIVCNKNYKTLKYRRKDLCVFVFIGEHGSLIACVAPGISIQSLTQSLFLTPTCRDTQLLY